MYSKYLKCDECGDVIDRRAKDDYEGSNRNTVGRGTFAPGEWLQLLEYAKSLGWSISGYTYEGKHVCPKHGAESAT